MELLTLALINRLNDTQTSIHEIHFFFCLLSVPMNDFIWRAACCLAPCLPSNVAFIALKTLKRSHDALAPVISCIPSAEQITTYSPLRPPSTPILTKPRRDRPSQATGPCCLCAYLCTSSDRCTAIKEL